MSVPNPLTAAAAAYIVVVERPGCRTPGGLIYIFPTNTPPPPEGNFRFGVAHVPFFNDITPGGKSPMGGKPNILFQILTPVGKAQSPQNNCTHSEHTTAVVPVISNSL